MLFNKIKISLVPIYASILSSCIATEINYSTADTSNKINYTIEQLQEKFKISLDNSNNYFNSLQNQSINNNILENLKQNTINTYKNLWELQCKNNTYQFQTMDECNFQNYLRNVNIFLLKNNISYNNDSIENIIYKYIIDDEINIQNYRNSNFHLKYFYMHHLNISNIFYLKSTLEDFSIKDKDNMQWFSKHILFRMKNYHYTSDIAHSNNRKNNNPKENRLLNIINNNIQLTKNCINNLDGEEEYNALINSLKELKYNNNSNDLQYEQYESVLYNDRNELVKLLENIRNIKYPPAPVEHYIPTENEHNTIKDNKPNNATKKPKVRTFADALNAYKPLAIAIKSSIRDTTPNDAMDEVSLRFYNHLADNIIMNKANLETKMMLEIFRGVNTSSFEDTKHILYTALKMIESDKTLYNEIKTTLEATYNALPQDENDIEEKYSSISEIIDLTINKVKLNEISNKKDIKYNKINEKEHKIILNRMQKVFNKVAEYKTDDLFDNIQNDLNNSIDIVKDIYQIVNKNDLTVDNNLLFLRELASDYYIKYCTGEQFNKDDILLYKSCLLALYCQKLVCDVYFNNFKNMSVVYDSAYNLCYKYLQNIHAEFIRDLKEYFIQ